jgi:hypothetical protein
MTEELKPEGTTDELPPEEQDEAVELASLAVDDGKGGKMVPLSALIGSKKTQRELQKRIKELEPVAARVTEIGGQLEQAQPIINAILSDPTLRARALKAAGGGDTRTSADTTEQSDDPDLIAFAEDAGYYLADNTTPDTARAKRQMDRFLKASGRQTDERIKPLAGVTLNARATENIRGALTATDADGTPWASRESIEEVVKQLPRELLADPQVTELILNTAIGVDRRKGRTPKPPDEPLFLERQGGRIQREAPLSSQERDFLKKTGISEKEYRQSSEQLATGRAIELGK